MLLHRYAQSYEEIVESVLPSDEAEEVCAGSTFQKAPSRYFNHHTLLKSGHIYIFILLDFGVCVYLPESRALK